MTTKQSEKLSERLYAALEGGDVVLPSDLESAKALERELDQVRGERDASELKYRGTQEALHRAVAETVKRCEQIACDEYWSIKDQDAEIRSVQRLLRVIYTIRELSPDPLYLERVKAQARLEALREYKQACFIEGARCEDSDFGAEEVDRRIAVEEKKLEDMK